MEEVSSVLYYKVLQWAGYSRNLKVAALERRLEKDGRYTEFTSLIESELGVPWREVQNDPLVIDSSIPEIAHRLYPRLFASATSFNTEAGDFVRFENERVQEMISIVREKSGKQFVIFIVDEVGQYVGSRQNLILNLDGLAKNLKSIGDGKVWIVGTAQQMLTEDDPRATLNSSELYKLKDRFPIQIDLESSDIKEICYRRLLAKSSEGEKTLGALFDKSGQALRHNTKLVDARTYDAGFDKTAFINLYPFLPAHFEILLHLLGALAKSTGGVGLRSAIKIIQDILVEGPDGDTPVADQSVGWLATTVTLYDALEKDIRRAFASTHNSLGKALLRFPNSKIHQDVAKTVAILQILGNMPVSLQNVTSLMHPSVEAPSQADAVKAAVAELIADSIVPFGENEGNLCFFSEKLNDIDQERAQIPLRTIEVRRIQNEAIRDLFVPLPSTQLHGSLTVTTGLKVATGAQISSLAGDRETIQTQIELVEPNDYDTARGKLVEESRHRNAQHTIFLIGRLDTQIEEKVAEIYRCQQIIDRYRNDPDKEVQTYRNGQADRAARLGKELEQVLRRCLGNGSFVFRGQSTAVDSLDQSLLPAAKKFLASVADQVFDRYVEAPHRAETALAESFLRVGNLRAITSQQDPLSLVEVTGGNPRIRNDHRALTSIRDYIDKNGIVEGKRLIDHFTGAPFGWSQDTLRYLVAGLLVAGLVKLKISGKEVTAVGQQAIDALRTNNAFKPVGVGLREHRPSTEMLARAAQRLTDVTGDQVIPLEDEITKVAAKQFPQFQHRFGPLAERLEALGLPGCDTVRALNQELADVLYADASDAPVRLAREESSLYSGIKWASDVENALKNNMESTVRELQTHRREIEDLPDSGVPGALRNTLAEVLAQIAERLANEDFHKFAPDLNTLLTEMKARTRDASIEMAKAVKDAVREAQEDLRRLSEWSELTQEEQSQVIAQLDDLLTESTTDLPGLKKLLTQQYVINSRVTDLKKHIDQLGRERRSQRLTEEKAKAKKEGKSKLTRNVSIPSTMTSTAQVDELIRRLQELQNEFFLYSDIEVTFKVED